MPTIVALVRLLEERQVRIETNVLCGHEKPPSIGIVEFWVNPNLPRSKSGYGIEPLKTNHDRSCIWIQSCRQSSPCCPNRLNSLMQLTPIVNLLAGHLRDPAMGVRMGERGLLGQPRFPKTLNQQRRV